METENIKSAVEAILFAAGEPVSTARISLILEVSEDEVLAAAKELSDEYSFNRAVWSTARPSDTDAG